MIEFELKLQVNEFPNLEKLEKISEKQVLDVYYDTAKYEMLIGGNFLRVRNNKKIDFKLDVGDSEHLFCKETSFNLDNFKPDENLEAIFKSINIKYDHKFTDFDSFLTKNKLKQLAVIDKERVSYKYKNIMISLDKVKDIGNFIELEMNFKDSAKFNPEKAKQKLIKQFEELTKIKDYKLINIGYVELYLLQHNKTAFELGKYKG